MNKVIGSRGLQLDREELTKAIGQIYKLLTTNFKISKKKGLFFFTKPKRSAIRHNIRITHPYEQKRVVIPVELQYTKYPTEDTGMGFEGFFDWEDDTKDTGRIVIKIPHVLYPSQEASYSALFFEIKRILVHELTHYFDKSLTSPKNRSKSYKTKTYREPAEAVALLNEFIEETRFVLKKYFEASPQELTPQWILSQSRIWETANDDNISPKYKKKFMRALGTLYQEWLEQRSKTAKLLSIASRLKAIANKLT